MRAVFAAVSLFAVAGLAVADLRFTEKSSDDILQLRTGKTSRAPRNTVVALKGRVVKFSENDGADAKPHMETVFDAAKLAQWTSNPRTKKYSEITQEGLKAQEDKAKADIASLEKKLPLMSGEKKKNTEKYIWLVKKMLGLLPEAPKVELKRTGEKQKVGNFECERVVIEEADETGAMQVVFDCWMTEAVDGWGVYADMYGAYRAFSPGVLAKMKEMKGFHVKGTFTVFWLTGELQKTTFDNSDASVAEVQDAEFQVPSDFTNTSKPK